MKFSCSPPQLGHNVQMLDQHKLEPHHRIDAGAFFILNIYYMRKSPALAGLFRRTEADLFRSALDFCVIYSFINVFFHLFERSNQTPIGTEVNGAIMQAQ